MSPFHESRARFADPELIADVEGILPDGVRYEVHDADSGRGASGYALALEIVGLVADAGGAATVGVVAWRTFRRVYDAVRRRTGRRPVISLGAAQFLAAADLVDR